MKYKFFVVAAFTTLLFAKSLYAQNVYYLPQVATGHYSGGSDRTTFILFNNSDVDTTAILTLKDFNGNSLIVTIPGFGTDSTFTIPLAAGATRFLQTDGSGDLAIGSAAVTCPTKIGVSAIFTIYDASGNYVTESGVGSSTPLSEFVIPVDTTGQFNTGLALMNIGNGDVTYILILRNTSGVEVLRTSQLTLKNGTQLARFVAGASQFFPTLGSFQGTVLVQSSGPLAALVLRQNGAPLSFTSLPVVSTTATSLTLNLAQVVDGVYSGGSIKMSFLIFNISTAPATVAIALTVPVTIPGYGAGTNFNIPLAVGGSIFLQTSASSPLVAGAATITSNVPVGASGIFTLLDTHGAFQTEAGVGDSPILTSLTLPVDITGNFDTGVAFFGPNNMTLTFQLLDKDGAKQGSPATRNLSATGHLAIFISEIFPGTSNFQGSVAITAPQQVAALTLRENRNPHSYTTLPVVSGVASGKAPVAALLAKIEAAVNATANITLNETLLPGFKLTGQVSGPGTASSVVASAGQSSIFTGSVDAATGKYLMVLPAGTYNLKVSFAPPGVPSGESATLTYSDPTAITITADATRNETLPAVTLFTVSGTVTGLGALPSATNASIVFTSNDNNMEGELTLAVDGSYQGVLPAGSYQASLQVPSIRFLPDPLQSESLVIYNLGPATISGNTVLPAYIVPATATLSGTISGSSLPMLFAGVRVSADDMSAPLITQLVLASPPSTSTASPGFTGLYQMVLAKNRSYSASVSFPLLQGLTMLGFLSFPSTAYTVNLTADTVQNFVIPAPPAQITISGKVTDNNGQGVSGVAISAVSSSLTGVPNLQFSGFAQTDANGNYSLVVLSGTNYQIIFVPPVPAS
jgi:hypothetical protein